MTQLSKNSSSHCLAGNSRSRATALALWFGILAVCLLGSSATQVAFAQEVEQPEATGDNKTDEGAEEAEKELDPLDGLSKLTGGAADPIDKLIDEMSENMKAIEELLNRGETGASTQAAQAKSIETIDRLIEEVEKRCSSCSSSSSSGKPSQSKPSQGQSKDQKRSQSQRQLEEQAKQQQKQQANQPKQQQQQGEPRDPQKSPNNQTREGQLPTNKTGELTDRQGEGRWGRLPGKVVEQMYDNGKRKLPERYRVLLEEYFRRLPLSEGQ